MSDRKPGTFVISIDVEMAWGGLHHDDPNARTFDDERAVMKRLLQMLDSHGISATWAIVGHLFLDRCGPFDGLKHPEVTRPSYDWLARDWFEPDPATSLSEARAWYGSDIVEMITGCPTSQEIASHSFSHLIAGDPGCGEDAFRSDLSTAQAVARSAGIELKSFVYPRNSIGHVEMLSDAGFKAYRGPRSRDANSPIQQTVLRRTVDKMIPDERSAVFPRANGDIVDVPQTYLFDPESTRAARLGPRFWTIGATRRIQQAARAGSLFHLWFHPHNITANPRYAWRGLESILKKATGEIDRGRMVNETMAGVADLVQRQAIESVT